MGGRILSVDEAGKPSADGFDLGPSWFWPGLHHRMGGILRTLGLHSFPQYSDGDAILERSTMEAPHRFPTMHQEPRSMRINGGIGAIVNALVSSVGQDHLHLGARVTHIAKTDSGIVLSASFGTRREEFAARQVILALPPRILASAIDFQPAVDPDILERWRRTATWMAPHAKLLALYDLPFWRKSGLSGTAQSRAGPLVEIHDATSASGAAGLFGFVGLDRKQRIAVGEDILVEASVAQLTRLFGPRAAEPRATLFKDWTADIFTSTQADEVAEVHPVPNRAPWITGAWAQLLSLAGSETSASDPGYLAGALDAAERAVGETIGRLQSR